MSPGVVVAVRPTTEEPPWTLCEECHATIYTKRSLRDLRVCPECGTHAMLTSGERLTQLLDAGSSEALAFPLGDADPLEFVDVEPYSERLARARDRTGMDDAVQAALGTVEGVRVAVVCMDFRFLGGSLGSAVGEVVTRVGETALEAGVPLLLVTASGGARMQEGALALMQMAKTSAMLSRLDDAGLLTISLISDPTYGGVAASFATLCDVIVAEPGARLGFAGRRVIEQTVGESLSDRFQTAESHCDRGFVDCIVARSELRTALARLLRAGTKRGRPAATRGAAPTSAAIVRDADELPEEEAWRMVQSARRIARPTTRDYIGRVFAEFHELHGDRVSGECSAIVGGVASLRGRPVIVLGQQKGHDAAELAEHNFGMARPAGYRKASRLMRLAQKLDVPVVTLIDTSGAFPGADAEEDGQSVAIADNLRLMSALEVPVVAFITGEGGSGGALALGVANRVLMWESSIYSVISPEGCASILWRDTRSASDAAEALGLRARDLLRAGVVDGVLREPAEGIEAQPALAAELLEAAVVDALDELRPLDGPALRADREARFRRYGRTAVGVPTLSRGER